ncbi:thiol:disulfide interchange protein DsbD [Sphaerotilus hippei]|uniref:Thiol:disulfide interchange protein DsbD n=1 Tax=Sphaerotilus hippei TaxID=744406 RepID=A0A318GZ40_9BURK|nr:protein-disulfide reductase DsbD [Sphaerotilus hippei]PXW95479.1 thiol:disulfide interchange protein DsbD [Sphaerotilus hippei]
MSGACCTRDRPARSSRPPGWRGLLAAGRRLCAVLLPVLLMFVVAVPASAAEEFLSPDDAFRLSVRAADSATLELRWEIAPGYYLYRERLEFAAAPAGVTLGAPRLPTGDRKYDETFQKELEVYHRELRVPLPVERAPALFRLKVLSQGCADAGLCYSPREQFVRVEVADGAIRRVRLLGDDEGAAWQPPAAEDMALRADGPAPAAEAQPGRRAAPGSVAGFEQALGSGSLWTVAAVFLLAGLLLSFTPCVLPMLPILSSIVVGQGGEASRSRGLLLSLAYSLGMAVVYTALGVAAGLAGEGLAALLQNAWVLGAFALLLLALSLSMFGLYELQLPAALQTRLSERSARLPGGRFGAVMLMGGVSALIVGPCVAAPLAGALLFIGRTGDVVLGGLALFSMAAGMSVPLVLVGASAGALLPRAGAWMEGVKRCFGVLLVAVALWMVSPVLPTWAVMGAWGSLALLCAVGLRLLDPLAPAAGFWPRLGKGLGLLLALVGLAQWVGLLSGGRDLLQPLAHLGVARSATAAPAAHALPFRRIRSTAELDEVLRSAGRPVMLDFYADWCVSCVEYERFTFTDARVRARLAAAVLLQVDVTANDEQDRALLKRFGLFGPPGILFFDAGGREQAEHRVIGFQDADEFLASLGAAGL